MKPVRSQSVPSSLPLRVWQSVVRGFHILDHVLRRGVETNSGPSDALVAGQISATKSHGQLSFSKVIAIIVVCGSVYGLAMGSYASAVGKRSFAEQIPQMFYSGMKVPMLIVVTLVVSIPSFYVINTLLGLRDDFRESLQSIISAQAGLTIILVSLMPVTVFVYLSLSDSGVSYSAAVLFNAAMFGVASISAQLLLRGYYEPLVRKNSRHRWMMRIWIVVYAFVGIQAAFVLRPFIGSPHQETTFFRRESFQNAYVKVWELVRDLCHSFIQ